MAISGLPLIVKVISFRVLFLIRLDAKRTALYADTAQKIRAIALPLSRAARAVRPNERAPLRGAGRRSRPGGEPAAAASTPVGQRSRAAGGIKERDDHVQATDRKPRPRRGQGLTGDYCLNG